MKRVIIFLIGLLFLVSGFSQTFEVSTNLELEKVEGEDPITKTRISYVVDFRLKSDNLQMTHEELGEYFFKCNSSYDSDINEKLSNIKKFLDVFVSCDKDNCTMKENSKNSIIMNRIYAFITPYYESCNQKLSAKSQISTDLQNLRNLIVKRLNALVQESKEQESQKKSIYNFLTIFNTISYRVNFLDGLQCIFNNIWPDVEFFKTGLVGLIGGFFTRLYSPIYAYFATGDFFTTFFSIKSQYAWRQVALKRQYDSALNESELLNTIVEPNVKGLLFSVSKKELELDKKYYQYFIIVSGNFSGSGIYTIEFKDGNTWKRLAYNAKNNSKYSLVEQENKDWKIKYFTGKTAIVVILDKDVEYAKISLINLNVGNSKNTVFVTKIVPYKQPLEKFINSN
ncbi:MAG: hypothetical protein QW524_01890 [Candidatus Woesearchaeota archaeon]